MFTKVIKRHATNIVNKNNDKPVFFQTNEIIDEEDKSSPNKDFKKIQNVIPKPSNLGKINN